MSDYITHRRERKEQARVLEYKKVDTAAHILGYTREEVLALNTVFIYDKLYAYKQGLSEEELKNIPEEDGKWASMLFSHCRMANRHSEAGCSVKELIDYMVWVVSGDYQYAD